ncbi:MAG: hypothetical protein RQ875_09505 [Vicingaceae bacterium]|nr:hypothetical protein [Vicingaceae bacterium]
MKPIQVKVTRAEKRSRKIILVIESDLYSDEVFAATPFYIEGDKKNQLKSLHLNLQLTEQSGKVEAKVFFGNCLFHFTKGHTQLHKPISTFYLTQKECALDWFMNEKQECYTDERIAKILKLWESDKEFHSELLDISVKRKKQFKIDALNEAKHSYKTALENLNKCLADASF